MDETKLKPRPFCGSQDVDSCPEGERSDGEAHLAYYVACNKCGCNGPIIHTWCTILSNPVAAREASIDLWNRRAK